MLFQGMPSNLFRLECAVVADLCVKCATELVLFVTRLLFISSNSLSCRIHTCYYYYYYA